MRRRGPCCSVVAGFQRASRRPIDAVLCLCRGNNETEDQESSPAGEGTDVAADQVANDDPAADAAGQPEQGPDAGASSSGNEDTAQNDPSDQPSPQGGQNSSQGEDKAPGAPLGSGDGAGDADAQQAGEARDKSDSNEADELASGGNDGGYESGGGAAGGDASGGAEGERKSKATPSELQAGNDGGGVDSAGASTALPPVSVKPAPNEGDAPGASPRGEHGSVELRTGRPLVESGAGTSPRGSHSHLALGVRPSVLEAATPLMERTGEIVPLSLSQLSDGEHLRAQIDLPVSFPCPAIVVVGTGRASEARKSHMLRLYQLGVLRAAGYSDAVVIDCGLNTCPSAARIRDKLAAHAVTLGVSPPHTADDMLHKQHHRQVRGDPFPRADAGPWSVLLPVPLPRCDPACCGGRRRRRVRGRGIAPRHFLRQGRRRGWRDRGRGRTLVPRSGARLPLLAGLGT